LLKVVTINLVVIAQQIAFTKCFRKSFDQLLGRSLSCRVFRYIEMQHTPPLVAQDYQTE
jgi:hypothetical protein